MQNGLSPREIARISAGYPLYDPELEAEWDALEAAWELEAALAEEKAA
jgi:hypothetical protein